MTTLTITEARKQIKLRALRARQDSERQERIVAAIKAAKQSATRIEELLAKLPPEGAWGKSIERNSA